MIQSQPQINIGIVGHVDHGKTTLTKALSGNWTDKHSEEKKRGITIKLGYTNFSIFKGDKDIYSTKKGEFLRNYSIVDSPGHESFMATMICGSSVMDYALLLVDVSEKFPMPQTIEHFKALENQGCKNIIIIQNKIDLTTKEECLKNFFEIKDFLKNTKFSNSKIIPMSAFYNANLSNLLKTIYKEFDLVKRDESKNLKFNVIKSFDINKPGTLYNDIKGGVLGVSIENGVLNIGDEIQINPGIKTQKNGKIFYSPISMKISNIKTDKTNLEKAVPGGCIAIQSDLDPFITKNDNLVGQVGTLKKFEITNTFKIDTTYNLFDEINLNNEKVKVKPILKGEVLMLIINSFTTIGQVTKCEGKEFSMDLRRPIAKTSNERGVIFRQYENKKWKIIGSINLV